MNEDLRWNCRINRGDSDGAIFAFWGIGRSAALLYFNMAGF